MNTPHDNMPDHDPEISALYRKTGNIEPPASLDKAVLASARRAVRQRRQRWILPLSTAAVLMLGITVLLKLNSEWQFSRDLEDSATISVTNETKSAEAPTRMMAKKAAPAPAESQALKTEPPSLATAPGSAPSRQTAREKAESAGAFGFSADTAPMSDSATHETESPVISGMAQAEQKVLEPKPWIEKVRKLVEARKLDEAKKELQAFRKHYPDYKLPDDVKLLLP